MIQALPAAPGHILIDGFPGAGKSTLARALAAKLDLPLLEVDRLVKHQIGPQRDRYVDTLDHDALRTALLPLYSCVVDGVTALDIADHAGVSVKAHIYIKHLGYRGEWHDHDEIELENEIDRFVAPSALRVCLRRYHSSRQPHVVCDAVFLRQDSE